MELDCLIKGKTPTLSNHSSKTIKRKAKGENPTNFFPLKKTNKTQTRINESKQANKSIISNKEKKRREDAYNRNKEVEYPSEHSKLFYSIQIFIQQETDQEMKYPSKHSKLFYSIQIFIQQ